MYFNDIDPYCIQWLRNLYPLESTDLRSIAVIDPGDLLPHDRVHLFAGIGGWEYALQLAGWPADVPVWTGSCPCQPYSNAGKRGGDSDERNLWPHMYRLIRECRPQYVFGEQVASAIGHGWLDGISADLEAEGYTVGAAVLGAHSVGAPHIRQRLYWVAHTKHGSTQSQRLNVAAEARRVEGEAYQWQRIRDDARDGGSVGRLAHTERHRLNGGRDTGSQGGTELTDSSDPDRVGDTDYPRPQGWHERRDRANQWTPWASSVAISCLDGRARRIEPSIQPLAHGVPARVAKLRAIGNAIVPQTAATFIRAFMLSCLSPG